MVLEEGHRNPEALGRQAMSYNLSVTIALANRHVSYVEIIQALLANGWSADNSAGGIHYSVPDDDGDADARGASIHQLDDILAILSKLEVQGKFFAISLFWQGTDYGVWLSFNSKNAQKDAIYCSYDLGRRVLSAAPPICDHNWYLDRLFPPLLALGCEIRSLVWKESS